MMNDLEDKGLRTYYSVVHMPIRPSIRTQKNTRQTEHFETGATLSHPCCTHPRVVRVNEQAETLKDGLERRERAGQCEVCKIMIQCRGNFFWVFPGGRWGASRR
jgi:hypothetical protein